MSVLIEMFGGVVVPGQILVFVMLGLLIGCVYLMSYIVTHIDKKKGTKTSPAEDTRQPAANVTPAPQQPVQPTPQQQGGEVVAAISAAVASVMESPHVITSVTPVQAAVNPALPAAPAVPERRRPVWGFAGMQQNNRPF